MGTSASSSGAGGSNPLVPSWINTGGGGGNENEDTPPNDQATEDGQQSDGNTNDTQPPNQSDGIETTPISQQLPVTSKRYTSSKKDFNKYVKNNGGNTLYMTNALKGYVAKGGGGSSTLSKRMRPSASRVVGFINTVNDIRTLGKAQALTQISLSSYINKPLVEILSALSDEIFKDTNTIYEDTQDDSITKQAYSNTIIRICEEKIDLDNLSNNDIELMTSIFIEETIAQRVICDIGNNLTKITTDISVLIEIENNVYQIIKGLVRNQIMPELTAIQLGNKIDLYNKIENVYRIAFDAILGKKD